MTVADKLTAAEHFANAEDLLARLDGANDARKTADATLAQAHIAAAEFLLKAHQITNSKAGLLDILNNRHAGGER